MMQRQEEIPGAGAVYPVGIIIESTDDGVRYLPNKDHQAPAELGEYVVIHNQKGNAHISFRAVVTEASTTMVTCRVVDRREEGRWPDGLDPKGYLNPVYRAGEQDAMLLAALARNNPEAPFMPDHRHTATAQQMQIMFRLAEEHEQESGIEPTTGVLVPEQRPYGNLNMN